MVADLIPIFTWWLYFFLIGLIFLPLTTRIFHSFFDRGYLFSKVFGVLFLSYGVWILAILKLLPFYRETIWLVVVLGVVANFWYFYIRKGESLNLKKLFVSSFVDIFAAEELIFLTTLIFWSIIRGFQPDIQGLEKFMDFGFVNSILRSKFFPPADMWFAGKPINYYYYGHYITAFLTKLSGIPSAITYNLMIATLFAFCFSLTFSLTANLIYFFKKLLPSTSSLRPAITAGLISALLVSLGANLHPAYYNFKMKILGKPYCNGGYNYWYPDATRYIGYCPDVEDKTIHEFPSYSFVVSDLHGHVSDIPFVMLFLALTFNLFLFLKTNRPKTVSRQLLAICLPMSWILAIMFMTNQWDYPIYLLVLGLTLLWGLYPIYKEWKETLFRAILAGIGFVVATLPFIFPFYLKFDQISKGIGLVWEHSLPHQLIILWGAPWFFGISFLIFLFKDKIKTGLKKESLVKGLSNALGVNVKIEASGKSQSTTVNQQLTIPDWFIIILLLASTLLIIIPEIIYVKDIYIPSYHRANTVFKLTYQSFIMFSVLIGYVFVRLRLSLAKGPFKSLLMVIYLFLITSLLIYPTYSITGYYGTLEFKNYKGLYGLKFLQKLYPDDYAAVLWLNQNLSGQPVVLEAVGDSYTDYERISMATGLPTIEGWLVHEWLWRGSFDEPGKRASEVQQIYESPNLQATKDFLSKYKVEYVLVGKMEKNKYPNLNEEKFLQMGKLIFSQGETKIYQVLP